MEALWKQKLCLSEETPIFCSQILEQCLKHRRFLINIWWVNDWVNKFSCAAISFSSHAAFTGNYCMKKHKIKSVGINCISFHSEKSHIRNLSQSLHRAAQIIFKMGHSPKHQPVKNNIKLGNCRPISFLNTKQKITC